MEQKESIDFLAAVLPVEVRDSALGAVKKKFVFRYVFLDGIAKIRQQAEVHIGITVGQEPDLKGFNQRCHILMGREHGWNHDERAQRRGDPLREIHPRQQVWRCQLAHYPVEYSDNKL